MRRHACVAIAALVLIAAPASLFYRSTPKRMTFPDGKRFAFSIVDDTDMATLARLRPVYELLESRGMRTTKTVWVYDSSELSNPANQGDSLRDPSYRQFALDLQRKGFEIALHGVRGGSSRRADVSSGLDEFKSIFGSYPTMYINHSLNKENLYWGRHVFAFAPYRWAGALAIRHEFSGHDSESPYFWGDLAQQHIRYVRRFTFREPNLLAVNPSFPYRLDDKPYVNYWFPTADGSRVIEFNELLKPENLARLDREGGVCLVYAHLGSGSFNKNGGLDSRFVARINELSAYNGWFAPASEILDHLKGQPAWTGTMDFGERLRVDTRFIKNRLLLGRQ